MIELENLKKYYDRGGKQLKVLDGIDQTFERGFHAITGSSGSGKTTLLQLIAGIQKPTEGSVKVKGKVLGNLRSSEMAEMRNKEMGFVYQTFNLLDYLTALENVMVPMIPSKPDEERAIDLLERVGIGDRLDHKPSELSGGEKQRLGIARALANDPDIVLADEPTGNLDNETSYKVMDVLLEAVGDRTFILATHDLKITDGADRVFELEEGLLRE